MGLLGLLKLRASLDKSSFSSAPRRHHVPRTFFSPSLPLHGCQSDASFPTTTSMFAVRGRRFIQTLKHHVKGALTESPPAYQSKQRLPHSAEPDASALAISGYRFFKILKNQFKGALAESPPAYRRTNPQTSLSFDGRGISSRYAHPFRAIGRHAFRAVCNPCKHSAHAFKAVECYTGPTLSRRHFGHSANPSKYMPHAFRGRKQPTGTLQPNQHGSRGVWHARNFARTYVYVHGTIEHFKAPRRMTASSISKGMGWSHWWRAAWQKLFASPQSKKSFLPPFAVTVKAVCLACARSHLPLGLMAIIFGGVKHSIAHAQGNTMSLQSSQSSFVLSSLFTMFEFFGLVARSLYLWVLFMPAVLTAPFANMFGGRFRQAWLHLVHRTLEFAGAAFIKWGQWAATRPDLFPRDLCVELTKLHANAPAHKFSHTVQTIERAFGKRLDDIFSEFEEKPVASGSIAQVHKATLRHGGPSSKQQGPITVAVKVRHPGVTDVIRRDFVIINWVANLSVFIPGLRWLRLDESVRQFAVFMLTQVDLAREAAHLSRFLYNFRSWRDVSFPRPVYPLVHPAVLVESYEQGESVSHFIELPERSLELPERSRVNRKLAHIGTHTFLKMLLVDNFIHADMHPGNILVRVDKKRTSSKKKEKKSSMRRSQPHLVFLDVGLTAELSQKDRGNLLDFFKAVALRDGRTAAQCALEFSNNQSCPNPAAFIKELESSFKFWGSREADVIHPGECMHDLLEQVRRHRVNIDGNVCTVMVTIMVLEGWQRKLDPDFSIMDTLQKLLFKQDWAESLAYTINGIMAP
eukprot:c21262_g1_i1 orf=258-2669(+)